jgi:hypothetical protein
MTFVIAEECLRLGLRAETIVFRDLHIGPASPQLRAEPAFRATDLRTRVERG